MNRFSRTFILSASALAICCAPVRARAAQLAGVNLPDTETVSGQTLRLNGIGLRTYSLMHVHVYVAGLYLPQPMDNADAILDSSSPKILRMHFVHDVSLDKVQEAWRTGLNDNCIAPCTLDQSKVDQFLSHLSPVKAGEEVTFVFNDQGFDAYENGAPIGHMNDPQFARLVLAVFIGPKVETPDLKRELLGQNS